jgi:hypothetical protein
MFAAADTNKDGKLTKEELANFVWKRFAKADATSVTKDDVKKFMKERIGALRAERSTGHRHKPHAGSAPKKEQSKPGPAAKPAPAAPKTEPKAEPKAEATPKPAPSAPAAAQATPPTKPATPTPPAGSTGQTREPANKPGGISKAEAAPPAVSKNSGSKIGTATTSGDVKAALFAARR